MRSLGGLVVVGAIVLAGCGGSTKTVTVPPPEASAATAEATTPETTESTASATSPAKTEPSCESLITSSTKGVGTCEAPGSAVAKYASPGHHLVLSGLTALYVSKRTETSIIPAIGHSIKAHGTFLIVTAQLTNREHAPEEWKNEQATLLVGGSTYTEDFNAENGPDQQSFVWKSSEKIQPEESQTGDVVFDLPGSALHALATEGAAVTLKDFGEEKSEESYGGLLLVPKG